MVNLLSANIISPLGFSAEENFLAFRQGKTALRLCSAVDGIPESFTAAVFTPEQNRQLHMEGFTRFESLVIRSIERALADAGNVDASAEDCILILSTTKANVEELAESAGRDGMYFSPGRSARRIARHFGMKTEPLVVCNACISGVTAQILAARLLENGQYRNAIVCGADCIGPFTVAGFLSFKSLDPGQCKPFDLERLGLNLGEAAATMILTADAAEGGWKITGGSLNNDAYHVSAPSPSGEGSLQVIQRTLEGFDRSKLGLIGAHGTATMFNDQMESCAIERAGLQDLPVAAIKSTFGHTLGASGIIESIFLMQCVDKGIVPGARGFQESGVSGRINISAEDRPCVKDSFIKIISGFGGCNGAILYSKEKLPTSFKATSAETECIASVQLGPDAAYVNGQKLESEAKGNALLGELYKKYIGDYPKVHKMDLFSRMTSIASELLLKEHRDCCDGSTAVVLFNSSSSIIADRNHLASISAENGFYPSPSIFLYTLPNVVTGEIAIRNGFRGETSLIILEEKNPQLMECITRLALECSGSGSMICGWANYNSENDFETDIKLIRKK